MSTRGFNELFAGYPRNATVERIRGEVRNAITQSLASMRQAQRNIDSITFKTRRSLQPIVTAVDTLEVWMLNSAPQTVKEVVQRLREPLHEPLRAYNAAAATRAGRMRRRGTGLKPAHFQPLKDAYIQVIAALITWLESVRPDQA